MRDFSQTLATLMCGFIMEQDLIKEITAENHAKQPQPGQSCKFFFFFTTGASWSAFMDPVSVQKFQALILLPFFSLSLKQFQKFYRHSV